VDGENVGLALPHKLWSNDAWTNGCAKNARNVVDQGTAILNALQQFLCSIHCRSIHQIFLHVPKGKSRGFRARILVPNILSLDHYRQSQVNFWLCN
jgi:hypothetical protein